MFDTPDLRSPLDRREFLKAAGVVAGALMLPRFDALGMSPLAERTASAAAGAWVVKPFPLTEVKLTDSVFTQKRDRMLNYALGYGGEGEAAATDVYAGPDRILSIFRANAGLDTKGAKAVGDWESSTGYLRGHYAGHFMSMLSQAYAGSGNPEYKQKLDYIVKGLAECQDALAAEAKKATPRVAGKFGSAVRLTGSPIGLAEHVSLPDGVVKGLHDFTIALWINPSLYDQSKLSDPRANTDQATLYNGTGIFDFGSPNPKFGDPALTRMYLVMRASNSATAPRFGITTTGAAGEQRLDAKQPLPVDKWTHLAITRSGSMATLYVDGEPVASNPGMTISPADLGVTTGNWLGRVQFPQRNVSYLNAQLDEFQIYDHALTADEVKSLTTSAGGSAGGGNVVWYRFDEHEGPKAVDSSGKGHHGTVIAPTDGRRNPGFLSAYPETQFIRLEEYATYGGNQGIWAPYYTLHKILSGLLDAHNLAGNGQALDVATRIGDWAHGRLSKLRPEQFDTMWNMYIAGEYGGANDAFASLHAIKPKPEYLATARFFDNRNVMTPTIAGTDVLNGKHANQHIPQFIGYLRVFEQNNDPSYHAAAQNFWDMVVPHRIYAHGGMGVGEIFRQRDAIAGSLYSEPNNHDHAETCPLYNMLKLSRNLFFHDADPKYMNYYEMGLYNQILGSRRDVESTSSPEVTYFVPVRPGERRSYGNVGTCCGGTGMENHTKYQDSIYFRSADDGTLYVNLYIPSVLNWKEKGFAVEQVTTYPFEGASALTVRGNGRLRLALRVPSWVRRGYTVSVNGVAQNLAVTPGKYVTIDRQWKSGDQVAIAMPLTFHTERTIDDPAVQSIYYGPTLLAVQAPAVGTTLETGLIPVALYQHYKLSSDFGGAMTPVAGAPLHFTLGGQTLAPFYVADPQAGQSQPYHVYLRRQEPAIVFGSVDAGVPNAKRADGVTFLDAVWAGAPFADQGQFVAAVQRTLEQWPVAGAFTAAQQAAVVDAARRAEKDLA